jgi:hypothetical protein
MKRISILFVLIAALALAYEVGAMSSTHYQLPWYVPLTGTGMVAQSTHYAAQLTLGQAAIGNATSTHYAAGLGYWYGIQQTRVYLPVVNRS